MPADKPSTNALHWFPMYPEKWLASAAINAMSPEQEGGYGRLLKIMWRDGEEEPWLPTDDRELASLSRLGSRWKKLGPAIRRQFVERDGRLYNTVLSEVWREQQAKHIRAVDRARRGGRARHKHSPNSATSRAGASHASLGLVLENQKDSLPRGAGALVPSDAPPPTAQDVRHGESVGLADMTPTGILRMAGVPRA